jgi:hypothetical protein
VGLGAAAVVGQRAQAGVDGGAGGPIAGDKAVVVDADDVVPAGVDIAPKLVDVRVIVGTIRIGVSGYDRVC